MFESNKQLLEFRGENTRLRPAFRTKFLVVSNSRGNNLSKISFCHKPSMFMVWYLQCVLILPSCSVFACERAPVFVPSLSPILIACNFFPCVCWVPSSTWLPRQSTVSQWCYYYSFKLSNSDVPTSWARFPATHFIKWFFLQFQTVFWTNNLMFPSCLSNPSRPL